MAKKFLGIRLKEEDYAFLQSFKPNGTITEAVEAAIQQLRNFQTTTQKLPNSDTRSIPSSDIPAQNNLGKWSEKQAKEIELVYEKQKAIQRAKAEGLREQERIKTEARAERRGHRQTKSTIDMGDSEGLPNEDLYFAQ